MRGGLSIVLISTVGIVFACPVYGQRRSCSASEERQAEKEIDALKTWGRIYRSYERFAHCDDGAVAEGYSDAVGKLLANGWRQFPDLVKLSKADNNFETFVVKHVDESLPGDILQGISKNARSACPADAKGLCARIADAASGADGAERR
jgi:hypothetical protein